MAPEFNLLAPGHFLREVINKGNVMGQQGEVVQQCSWCFPSGSPGHNPNASHGLCLPCMQFYFPDLYRKRIAHEKFKSRCMAIAWLALFGALVGAGMILGVL